MIKTRWKESDKFKLQSWGWVPYKGGNFEIKRKTIEEVLEWLRDRGTWQSTVYDERDLLDHFGLELVPEMEFDLITCEWCGEEWKLWRLKGGDRRAGVEAHVCPAVELRAGDRVDHYFYGFGRLAIHPNGEHLVLFDADSKWIYKPNLHGLRRINSGDPPGGRECK